MSIKKIPSPSVRKPEMDIRDSSDPANSRKERHSAPPGWPEGIPVPKPGPFREKQKWTDEEIDLLRRYYPLYGREYCSRLLGRTMYAVTLKADRLGFPRVRRWTAEEDETLKSIYESGEPWAARRASRALGRTLLSVSGRAGDLGLAKRPRQWTAKERAVLKKNYGRSTTDEIALKLGKTSSQVRSMAARLGFSRRQPKATDEDVAFIKANAGGMSLHKIARALKLPEAQVTRIASELGITTDRVQEHAPTPPPKERHVASRNRMEWTEEDRVLLKEVFPTHGPRYTARLLGRTNKSTSEQARKLGLRFEKYRPWTAEEVEYLKKHKERMSTEELALKLGRTPMSIDDKHKVLRRAERQANSD